MYQIEISRLILEALQEMRETNHLAEVPFDVRSDVLLQRALEALVVRLPDGEELLRTACARDLDEQAVPSSVTPILQHDPVSRIRYVSAYPYPILRYTFAPLSFAEI